VLQDVLALALALALALNLLALRSTPRAYQPFLVGLWFVLSLFWKSCLMEHQFAGKLHLIPQDWSWIHLNLWAVAVLVAWFTRGLWWAGLWCTNLFFSLLYWVDILYYRYFDDLPGVYVLSSFSQGVAARDSARALIKPIDANLFFDLVLMLVAFCVANPKKLWKARWPAGFAPTFLALTLGVNWFNLTHLSPAKERLLRLRFHNMAMVDELGLFHYHLYDVAQNLMARSSSWTDPHYDHAALAELVRQSRESVRQFSPFQGSARGCNLLMIQLESMESFPLDLTVQGHVVTPFLNQLQHECLVAALQDQTGQGRTSDGEFVYQNSLLPPGERPLVYTYPSNDYRALPAILDDAGYDTTYTVPYYGSFWNCRFMSEHYGYKHDKLKDDYGTILPEEEIGWGLSDSNMFKRIIPWMQAAPKPCFFYAVTVMGHHPYAEIKGSARQLNLTGSLANTMLSDYLECCRARDDELRKVVAQLKSSGLWDTTVVVMYGDHDARIPDSQMGLLENRSYDKIDKVLNDRVLFMLHTPGDKVHGLLTGLIGQVDVAPTILHLLGITDSKSAFTGLNLLGKLQRPFIVSKGDYAIDKNYAVMEEDGNSVPYRRSDHEEAKNSALVDAVEAQFKLYQDILRLNLVPKMLP
jgi:lipoteichoic acid synthase